MSFATAVVIVPPVTVVFAGVDGTVDDALAAAIIIIFVVVVAHQ